MWGVSFFGGGCNLKGLGFLGYVLGCLSSGPQSNLLGLGVWGLGLSFRGLGFRVSSFRPGAWGVGSEGFGFCLASGLRDLRKAKPWRTFLLAKSGARLTQNVIISCRRLSLSRRRWITHQVLVSQMRHRQSHLPFLQVGIQ